MPHYCPSWSRTQRDLFFKCPTSWVLTYAKHDRQSSFKSLHTVSEWNLMLRSIKATIVDQLEALRSGIEWSESVAQFTLRQHLKNHIRLAGRMVGSVRAEALLLFAQHRMRLFWRTDVMVELVGGTYPQWSVLDRTESEHVDGYDLYASPDIAYFNGSKWCLVRFDMQGADASEGERLETLAMVVWSLQRHGLPNLESKYHLQTIGWRKGAWITLSRPVIEQEVQVARDLIAKDVAAMSVCAEASTRSMAGVALANDPAECLDCKHKVRCLNGNTLEQKKRLRVAKLCSEDDY